MSILSKIYLSLISLILYVPNWTVIDLKGQQWLLLSSINALFIAYTLINKSDNKKYLSYPVFLSFLSLFTISLISATYSINLSESISKLTDIFSILSTLYLLYYFIAHELTSLKFLLTLVLITLIIDLTGSYYQYFTILSFTEFDWEWANNLRGFYGNKNMGAVALMIKLPMIMVLGQLRNNKLFSNLIFVISVLTFYLIFLLSSRTAFLALFLCIIITISLLLIKKLYFKKNLEKDIKQLSKYFIPLILGFLIFKLSVNQTGEITVESRVSSVINNSNDESTSERFRFYSHALEHISNNILLGSGIGSWRIVSIKYDSENMFSYVVPYFVHNDILEIFAETGILGFLSYLAFFFYIFKRNVNQLLMWLKSKYNYTPILFGYIFIFIFVDANLNFPLDRFDMQIVLVLSIAALELNSKYIMNEKN